MCGASGACIPQARVCAAARTEVHRGADVALRAKVLAAVVLRKDRHNVSMGKDCKGGAVFKWSRRTLKS